MKYKTLGNSGLLVSMLCLGTMTFGDGSGVYRHIGKSDQNDAEDLIKDRLRRGRKLLDTADVYSAGASEKILGQSFRNLGIDREDVVIATKVGSRMGKGRNDVGAWRGHIMDAVEASLRRLQSDHIDLYQIHANDAITPVEAPPEIARGYFLVKRGGTAGGGGSKSRARRLFERGGAPTLAAAG